MKADLNDPQLRAANRSAAWRWGGFVVGLLTLQVAGGVCAIMLATGDPSVAVVPNYHDKAMRWDEEVALKAASERLGWTAEIDTNETPGSLAIRVRKGDGNFVEVASGTIEIYRHARAADVLRIPVRGAGAGAIQVPECFDADGRWQVSLDLKNVAGDRFIFTEEVNVGLATADASAGAS